MSNSFLEHVFDMNAHLQSVTRPKSAAWRTASIELSEYLKGSPDANMCTCIRALNIVNAARRETDADLKLLRRLHGELGEDVEKDSCHLKVDPVRLSETVLRLMGFQDCSDNENAQYQAHMVALRDTDIQIHTELCQTINWALVIRRNIHMHDLIKEGNKKIWEALGKIVKADAIKSQEGYLRRTSDLLRWQLDEHVRENVSGGAWQYLEMVVKLLTDSWVEDGGDGVGSTKVVKYDGGRDVPVA